MRARGEQALDRAPGAERLDRRVVAVGNQADEPGPEPEGRARERAGDRGGAVLAVSGEELVGTLAGQRHRDVARRELGQGAEAECRQIRERLVHVPAEVLEVDPVVERQLELVVVGAENVGDVTRVGELVRLARPREAHGERLHRLVHVSRHERHDQARVEPAGKHRAERHVAHQAEPDRLVELLEQPLCVLGDREARHGSGRGYVQNARPLARRPRQRAGGPGGAS